MANFLLETVKALEGNGKSFDDVRWIESADATIPIDLFKKYANFIYDEGYGAVEINPCLRIVGDGWYLERQEYDGSEWWTFALIPIMPERVVNEKDVSSELRVLHNEDLLW